MYGHEVITYGHEVITYGHEVITYGPYDHSWCAATTQLVYCDYAASVLKCRESCHRAGSVKHVR